MRSIRRFRGFTAVGVLTLALGVSACGGDDESDSASTGGGGSEGGEMTTIKFIQPLPESVYFYPLIVGKELGYFEAEGVNVELLPASEDVPLSAFVSNGDADIAAAGAAEVLQGLAEGAEYDVIYDYYTKSAENLVVPEDSPIQSAEELEGKTVGLSSDEDSSFLQASLDAAGLERGDLAGTPKVGTSGPIVADAIRNDKIQAYSGALSDFAALEASGIPVRDITPEELARTPAASFIAAPGVLEEKSEAIEGFLRAWAKATHAGVANREAVEQMARAAVPEEWRPEKIGEAALDVSIDYQTPVNDIYGELQPDVWDQAQQQLFETDELAEEVEVDAFLDDRFIEEANNFDHDEVKTDTDEWLEQNAG